MGWQFCCWLILVPSLGASHHGKHNDPYNIPLENIQLPDSFQGSCGSNLAALVRCLKLRREHHGDREQEMYDTPTYYPHKRHGRGKRLHNTGLNLFDLLSGGIPEERGHRREYSHTRKNGERDGIDSIFRKIIDNRNDLQTGVGQAQPGNINMPAMQDTNNNVYEGRRYRRRSGGMDRSEISSPEMENIPSYNSNLGTQQSPYYSGQFNGAQNYDVSAPNGSAYMSAQFPNNAGVDSSVYTNGGGSINCGTPNMSGYDGMGQQTGSNTPLSSQSDISAIMAAQKQLIHQPFQMGTPQVSMGYSPIQQQVSVGYPSIQSQAANPAQCSSSGCDTDDNSSESEEAIEKSSERVEIRCMCKDMNGTIKKCKCKRR